MKTNYLFKLSGLFISLFITQLVFSRNDAGDTVVIKTSAICEMCKERIEKALAYEKGVISSNLDLETKNVTIVFKPQVITEGKLKLVISKTGYQADEVKADEKAYHKLPACCKDPSKHQHE